MTLTYGLSSSKDLFAKLRRDGRLLEQEVNSDHLFNFVVTGYSLIDWIKNDPSVPGIAKASAAILYSDGWLRVCGDLATAAKHFVLSTRVPITNHTSTSRGFGQGRWGKGAWGIGEESIVITLDDGSTYSCLDLVNGVLQTWQGFFTQHRIPL